MTVPIPMPDLTAPPAVPVASTGPAVPAATPALAQEFAQLLGACLGTAPPPTAPADKKPAPADKKESEEAEPNAPALGNLFLTAAAPQANPQPASPAGGAGHGGPNPALDAADPAPASEATPAEPALPVTTLAPQWAPPPAPDLPAPTPVPASAAPTATPAPTAPVPAESATLIAPTRDAATLPAGTATETQHPRPPGAPLAFLAKLSDRAAEQARRELLASLAAPEVKARALETAPARPAGLGVTGPAPQPQTAVLTELPPGSAPEPPQRVQPQTPTPPAQERPVPAAEPRPSQGQPARDLDPPGLRRPEAPMPRRASLQAHEPRPAHRAASGLPHPVFGESRTPPMAPYRTPEFVATQPGTRTPWNAPVEPPLGRLEVPPAPVRDLSLEVPSAPRDGRDQAPVQVRVTERSGEVRIAVHTPDAELAQTMRQGLQDLVQRLEQSGYRTETWSPAERAVESIRHQDAPANRDFSGQPDPDSRGPGHHHPRQPRQRQQEQSGFFDALASTGADLRSQENLR